MLLNEKICGLGDPENLLYHPDRGNMLNTIIAGGGNGIYCHFISGKDYGWGGDFNGSPFVNNDPNAGLNPAKMQEFQAMLGLANAKGIWTFLFLYDDDCNPYGDQVTAGEDIMLQQLVTYLGPLDRLVWVIAEEYTEAIGRDKAQELAKRLHQYDGGRHTIGIHQHSGLGFDFGDDPYIKLFMVQWIDADRQAIAHGLYNAWLAARGRYQIILSESTHPKEDWYLNGTIMRRKNWAALFTGCTGALVYTRGDSRWDQLSTEDHRQIGVQTKWTRLVDRITEMEPMPWTVRLATEYCLKDPDEDRWLLYTTRPGPLGCGPVSPGEYEISWYDCISGGGLNDVQFLCGYVELNRLPGIGQECSCYVRKK